MSVSRGGGALSRRWAGWGGVSHTGGRTGVDLTVWNRVRTLALLMSRACLPFVLRHSVRFDDLHIYRSATVRRQLE